MNGLMHVLVFSQKVKLIWKYIYRVPSPKYIRDPYLSHKPLNVASSVIACWKALINAELRPHFQDFWSTHVEMPRILGKKRELRYLSTKSWPFSFKKKWPESKVVGSVRLNNFCLCKNFLKCKGQLICRMFWRSRVEGDWNLTGNQCVEWAVSSWNSRFYSYNPRHLHIGEPNDLKIWS